MTPKPSPVPASNRLLGRLVDRTTEPAFLFPAIALLVLGVIWGTTLNLIKVERSTAENTATLSSRELAETYEAQVVRALREIDQALKVVKYTYERGDKQAALKSLKDRGLLPPDLLFFISIVDNQGTPLASTRPSEPVQLDDADKQLIASMDDKLRVGRTRKSEVTGEWQLQFSRRLNAADGSVAGMVTVAVNPAYFVSGYDTSKLGEHGTLALLGTDGVFRVRRTGETVSVGDLADYAAVVRTPSADDPAAAAFVNAWDGVRRYTSARPLYDFPMAVIVGLSTDEALQRPLQNRHIYLIRATAASALLAMMIALLGRLSSQLADSRRRAVEEQLAHAARVEHLAYHDALTGLPNRSLFSKLLMQSIQQAHRYSRQLAVLFLDLDRFKQINDTLGHEAGDQLLQQMASRLKTCLRDSDTVARLGGDEFVVLLPELHEEKYAATVAQKILVAVGQPFMLIGQEFRVTTSIGICTYPQDGLDEQTLTKNADIAMYQAKEEGKNNYQFYSDALNANSLERLTLESALRQALEQGEFTLHYQVKRDVRQRRITGMEVLLRWQHPSMGTIAPLQFIPMAEETGLIVPIGKWVLRTACQQNVAWQKQGLPALSVAVNLTPRQFSDERLLSDLRDILNATGMSPYLLELEIAESLLMRDVEKSLRMLAGLKQMGIRVAIDDFGLGYASLATLQQFPIDTIKIDRSFIRDIASDSKDKPLADAVIAMGHTLSLTVVAQGVETKEQAEYLRDNACDQFQGFYVSMPVPAHQLALLLRAENSQTEHQPAG